jgi:broad specificity phosphatase PhoE
MRPLYLIRHASPVIRPGEPPREWPLSERGIAEAQTLAGTVADWDLEALYCSSEAKARSTALIIGDAIGLTVRVADTFDELRIADWISNADEFNDAVRAVLEGEAPPRGAESRTDAAERFAEGVAIAAAGPMPAAIVSHGRILTAYLAEHRPLESAFEYWRSIPMPGWVRIDLDAPGDVPAPFAS